MTMFAPVVCAFAHTRSLPTSAALSFAAFLDRVFEPIPLREGGAELTPVVLLCTDLSTDAYRASTAPRR